MRKKQVQLITAVACSLAAFSASAAEPCKAYVKLDLGYGFTTNTRAVGSIFNPDKSIQNVDQNLYKNGGGIATAAGVGYAFNDALRAEVLVDFKPKMKSYGDVFVVETRELGGSVRLAYDFNNNTPVTPFIFGQLGASNVKPKVKPYISDVSQVNAGDTQSVAQIDDKGAFTTKSSSLEMKAKTVMTYQGGFGLSVKGSDIMNVDLTYGIGSKSGYNAVTNTAVVNTSGTTDTALESIQNLKFKKQIDQSLTLGFRFTM